MREIGRFKADLPRYLWHLLQQINRHPVGRIEVNPETVDGYHRCIGEPAAPFWGGRFVPIIGNSFDCEDNSFDEAGDLRWHTSQSSASIPLLWRLDPVPSGD
jgi:hypothetical protein